MTIDAATVATPGGELALLVQDDVLVAAGFAPVDAHYARLQRESRIELPRLRTVRSLGRFTDATSAYVDGDLDALDALPAAQQGGPFWQAAWKVMRDVPPGSTITYAELAARAGNPRAIRAAGSACARNRIAPMVPCHRIVRTGGDLGGYYYGLSTKDWLLAHERGDDVASARRSG
jgi:methylated-DNA-[protein]-cysteine S-methyltransferase